MANTYYDSELTAEEIEDVLEAISGILTQANNGKVLAISNGKIEARSVQWGGGGGAVVQSLSVTQNGTYNPPSGVDGYAPVTVNVSGGGSNTVVGAQGGDEYTADSNYGYAINNRFHIAESAPGTNFHNWWGSASANQHWWKVTFENAKTIKQVSFANYWRTGSSYWQTNSVTFQGSNDNSTWVDLLVLTDMELSNDQQSYSIENNTAYKYYRFVCSSVGSAYVGLGKIQMFI